MVQKGEFMKKNNLVRWYGLALVVSYLLLTGCATATVQNKQNTYLPGLKRVVVAPPLIEYRDIESNNPKEVSQSVHDRICQELISAIRDCFAHKSIEVSGMSGSLPHTCQPIGGTFEVYRITKMDRSTLSERERELLSNFLKATGGSHILFVRSRFYIGTGGFWNPFGGQIAAGSSRTVLDAHLFSTDDKKIVWKQTAQVRESPDSDKQYLTTAIAMLLDTLKVK
jgi:hypothetical protein